MPGPRRTVIRACRPVAPILITGLAAGCGAAATHSSGTAGSGHGGQTTQGVPQRLAGRDYFTGSIRSGSGAYAGNTGRIHIYLQPTGRGLRRSATITLAGLPCTGATHCLDLSGRLGGTLTASAVHIPDVGRGYALTGTGSVHPLGRVTGRGQVQGTGFIARGHESLTLTLTGGSGSVTVQALSSTVGGFTSP